eukprot:TRINITY_DN3078_c0_g1_i2.p1 TRINITY_DN3078_c0_g1~~TRINITY_DN3078_c0_g1_i2.p1  ORF type:complete len:663 (+),score=161.33 TRINITY_DN3078_c0_g1_i2:154-2142(+)
MDDRVHILPFGSLWSSPGVAFLSPNLFPSVKSMELKSHEEVSKEKDAEESEKGVPSSTKVISKIHTKKGHAYFTSRRLKLDFFSTTRRPECVLHPWTRIFCQESSNYDDARISVFHISSIEARSASRVVLTVEGNAERVKRNVRICGIETCFASPSFIIDKGCWIALQMGEDGIVPCRVETIEFGPTTRDGDILFGKITPTTRFEFRSKTLTKEIDIHSDAMLNRLRAISGASAWRTCQDLLFSMEHRKLKDRSSVVGVKGLPLPQSLLIWGAPGVGKTHFLSMLQEYLTLHLGCACCAFNAEKAWIYPQRIRHGTWSLPDGVQVKSKIRMETTEDGIHDFMNTTTRPTCLIMDDMDDILSWDPLTLQEQHGGSIEGIGELQKKFDDIVSWRRKDTSRTLIACVRDISGVLHRFRAGGDTFHMEAYIPNPDERQRVELMTNFLSSDSSSFENIRSLHLDGEAVESLALNLSKPTQGFVARDIVQLFHRANGMIHKYFRHDISLNLEALKSIFDKACRSVVPSELEDLSTIVSVSQKKEDLAGYKWLMNRILKLMRIAFLQSEDQKEAEHLGVGRTKGIFLFGPSGCGKTHMIRCVAGEINASFVEVRSTDVFSKYFGESERRLRSLFARARRLSPCVLVFEEMDSLAPDRSISPCEHSNQNP